MKAVNSQRVEQVTAKQPMETAQEVDTIRNELKKRANKPWHPEFWVQFLRTSLYIANFRNLYFQKELGFTEEWAACVVIRSTLFLLSSKRNSLATVKGKIKHKGYYAGIVLTELANMKLGKRELSACVVHHDLFYAFNNGPSRSRVCEKYLRKKNEWQLAPAPPEGIFFLSVQERYIFGCNIEWSTGRISMLDTMDEESSWQVWSIPCSLRADKKLVAQSAPYEILIGGNKSSEPHSMLNPQFALRDMWHDYYGFTPCYAVKGYLAPSEYSLYSIVRKKMYKFGYRSYTSG